MDINSGSEVKISIMRFGIVNAIRATTPEIAIEKRRAIPSIA